MWCLLIRLRFESNFVILPYKATLKIIIINK